LVAEAAVPVDAEPPRGRMEPKHVEELAKCVRTHPDFQLFGTLRRKFDTPGGRSFDFSSVFLDFHWFAVPRYNSAFLQPPRDMPREAGLELLISPK
jgi:hypothetical protein